MNGFYDPLVYDARSQGVPGDVEFFLGLAHEAHEAGHPVLELATGTGRVAIPIARAGIRVAGLDLHAEMLARAGSKVEALYGDCFGGQFGDTSPEMVWVARLLP